MAGPSADRLLQEKATLRKRMRAIRAAIPAAERARLGVAVEERLLALPDLGQARTILIFYSFGSEVPTAGIAARLAADGRRVLLPFVDEGTMAAAEFVPGRGEALVRTVYGPKEPAERTPIPPGEVDAVVAPGLAFDREGHRLGYGGGHYDGYLGSLRPEAVRLGIAFHAQLIPHVPHGPQDQLLDVVVTDHEVIRCPARGGRSGPPGR